MYNDPSGEFAFLVPILGKVVAGFVKAAVIGAVIGGASYTIGLAVTGNLHQWKLGGMLKSMGWGAVSGAVTFGIGEIFSSSLKTGLTIAESLKQSIGGVGLAMVQGGTHAIAQGVLSLMQGGNFVHGAVAGFAGHLGAEAWGGAMKGMGYEQFAKSTGGMVAFGALSGGIGAELSGGNFWQGAVTGGIVAGLNSAMHKINQESGPPWDWEEIKEWAKDYFDYNGDGKVAGWDYALGVVDVGMTAFDILTIPSGEGMATHFALKGSARVVAKTSFNISAKSIKGYNKVREIGGKYVVYSREVKASNLKGQAKAIYYKVFDTKGNTIKMYKDSYRIDGTFYHRRNIKPEFKNTPRYSK